MLTSIRCGDGDGNGNGDGNGDGDGRREAVAGAVNGYAGPPQIANAPESRRQVDASPRSGQNRDVSDLGPVEREELARRLVDIEREIVAVRERLRTGHRAAVDWATLVRRMAALRWDDVGAVDEVRSQRGR